MRIAIIAHGHPDLSAGGAERAAYSLFQNLKDVPGIEPIFLARVEPERIGHGSWFGSFRGRRDEFLWAPPGYDWFRRVSQSYDVLRRQIETVVDYIKPDVVHFHHYIFFGVEAFDLFREFSPRCNLVLTLHEFALMCNSDGQMVKAGTLRLCYEASPAECSLCFPDYSAGKFFFRERLIKDRLASVDMFISPSRFLRDRHVAWGIEPDKIEVIENLLPANFGQSTSPMPTARKSENSQRVRFGFFGQLNRYKGAGVLLDALKHLPENTLERIEVIIFGAKLELQPQDFQDALRAQLRDSPAKVSFFGPYRNEDVGALLRSVDWMVIPSIWWENSPLVIQEARATGTPILASNIGGMEEKVRDGIDGAHFLVGNSLDLATKIDAIVAGDIEVSLNVPKVGEQNALSLGAHVGIYNKLRNVRARASDVDQKLPHVS